jgi:hypothetical protein
MNPAVATQPTQYAPRRSAGRAKVACLETISTLCQLALAYRERASAMNPTRPVLAQNAGNTSGHAGLAGGSEEEIARLQ